MRITSLSTRLVFAAIATSAVTFTVLVASIFVRLEQSLERQSVELGRLSEAKLKQRLDGGAKLAGARIEMLFSRVGRSLESIAQLPDIVKAASSGNVVDMSERLQRTAQINDIDGIIVVDAKMRVIGASNADIDLVETNRALHQHPIGSRITRILADNDRKTPTVLREAVRIDGKLAKALRASSDAELAFIGVEPLFDDFGDVFAALIGHRMLRDREAVLEDFSRLEGAGLLVLSAGKPISTAGIPDAKITLEPATDTELLRSSDGNYWSRCIPTFETWQTCALAPVSELHALRDELVRIGETEGRSLARWLLLIAIAAVFMFAVGTFILARHISRPLERITAAVRAVARGDWKSHVVGSDRQDEVGDIARAVLTLQRSLEERDRLRSDVAQAAEVKKRREMLEDAIRRFDRTMRTGLLSVSDTVESMDETARELARMSTIAEGEAVEAAFVSEHTVSNVSSLRLATERLGASISETAERIRQTTEMIGTSSAVVETASAKTDELRQATRDIDRILDIVDDVAARAGSLALKATIEAARPDPKESRIAEIASDIQSLADHIARTNQDAARRVTAFRGMSEEAIAAVGHVAQKLDFVLQQVRTIVMAMERQDAATREITSNMVLAASGTLNVSASVDRVKETIEGARGASVKVIAKATDVADEAHRLDSTVKSFLREVTA